MRFGGGFVPAGGRAGGRTGPSGSAPTLDTGTGIQGGPLAATTAWDTTGVYRGQFDGPNRVAMFESPDGINRPITGPILDFGGTGATWANRRSSLNFAMGLWDDRVQATNGTLMLSTVPWPSDEWVNGGATLAAMAAGDYDANYVEDAERLLVYGYDATNVIMRPMWEQNGFFYQWTINTSSGVGQYYNGANAITNWIAAWRNMVDAMRSVISGLQFCWCPFRSGNVSAAVMESAYPGDTYVDIIGLDAYNWGMSTTDVEERWDLLIASAVGITWHYQFAQERNKPMSFPEWGITSQTGGGGNDPYHIGKMNEHFNIVGAAGYLHSHMYFEYDESSGLNSHMLHTYNGDASYTGTHTPMDFGGSTSTTAFDNVLKAA